MSPAPYVRRTLALTAGVLLASLLSPAAQATAATSASLDYTCLPEKSALVPTPTAFDMPVAAQVEAKADGATVRLSIDTGRPVIPDVPEVEVTMRSTMTTTVDGASVTLAGSRTVTFAPGAATDLPVLTGSLTSPKATLALTPGPLRVEFAVAIWTVAITCTPTSTPVIQVPVGGRTATPPPAPAPAPAPVKPVLKAGLTKKVQVRGKAPAKVVVTLAQGKAAAQPRGTVRVKVGKRVLVTRSVTKGTTFRVALPRTLKVGRHTVTVTFTPRAGSAHLRATASTKVRVRR